MNPFTHCNMFLKRNTIFKNAQHTRASRIDDWRARDLRELVLVHLEKILAHTRMGRLLIIVRFDNFQCTRTLLLRSYKITKPDKCTLPIAATLS